MRKYLYLVLIICQSANASSLPETFHEFFAPEYMEAGVKSALFNMRREPEKENVFIFSPNEHTWAVYDKGGMRVGLGKATGGKDFCPDMQEECRTVEGRFRVFRKEDKECTSKTFPIDEGGGAPMPYCMFFHKGYAIHGSANVSNLNISHGCIRVSKAAAKWISKYYIHEGSYVYVLPYA